jgi:hypothetical protein
MILQLVGSTAARILDALWPARPYLPTDVLAPCDADLLAEHEAGCEVCEPPLTLREDERVYVLDTLNPQSSAAPTPPARCEGPDPCCPQCAGSGQPTSLVAAVRSSAPEVGETVSGGVTTSGAVAADRPLVAADAFDYLAGLLTIVGDHMTATIAADFADQFRTDATE